MGISGLLPLLKKASKNSHVRKFSGCTVAIDAYCWLHKGAFGCAEKLGKGEPTDAYITYCMKYIQILLDNKIKPILVLDGRNLPSKAHTEKKRREKREENRKLARKYLQEGNRKGAWECFTRCVDITPAMAREFIKVLRSKKIDYVVAPYEADAQSAYLAKTGVVDIVITEDSDLVLFGCPRVFFKMNINGDGVLLEQEKLPQCLGLTKSKFNFDHFRWMCILSGCDYLPSLPGIGLGRAKKVVLALPSTQNDIREMILSMPSVLDKVQVEITDEYIDGFIQAENTFLYQLVFDTRKRMLIPLNPYPEDLKPTDLPFAGSYEHRKIAVELALGNVDLHSLKSVDCFEPLKSGYTSTSIWSQSFEADKKPFAMNELKASASIGMQIPDSVTSKSKKKRPLAVVNSDNDDNNYCPDDNELMDMYGEQPTSRSNSESRKITRSHDSLSLDDEPEVKYVAKAEDSYSGMKRRRITKQETEENHSLDDDSPSCNTRTRGKVVPFLKSPKDSKVHVKSKYFRTEEVTALRVSKLEVKEIKSEESDDESENEGTTEVPNLNIYSHESSQDSALSDLSASQHSSTMGSQQLGTSEYFQNAGIIKECSVVINHDETPVISIEGEDDDEAYYSSKTENASQSQPSFSSSSRSTRFSSSHASSSPLPSISCRSKTPSVSLSKPSSARRIGLSKSAKKDPKQPSVRDIFTRHKSVQ